MCVFLRARRKSLWLAKLARSSHEATANGSSAFISAAITKRINASTTTERSMVLCAKPRAHLTRKLRERDLGRDLERAKITLNEYLDRWLETAVRPRVRAKTFQDYQGMLRRYVRPIPGERVLARNATAGSSEHISPDERTRPVRSDSPLHACRGASIRRGRCSRPHRAQSMDQYSRSRSRLVIHPIDRDRGGLLRVLADRVVKPGRCSTRSQKRQAGGVTHEIGQSSTARVFRIVATSARSLLS